jgi:hypothetical protein
MARTIDTTIEIDAPIEKVWAEFADFERWPEWNPFIVELGGEVAAGGRLDVRMQPPGGKAMTFRPEVLEFAPERELRWLGRVLLPGVFDGEHRFRLESVGDDRTRFTQSEKFRGVLAGLLMRGKMLERTARGFEAMNQALKRRVENPGD